MEQISLDAIDLALLAQLQQDASLSNLALAEQVHVSPPTCLRRVKRLREAGWIERQVAVLSVDKLASLAGHGLCAVVEVTLDRQDQAALEAFEAKVGPEDPVQQCYRVSPGPDFCLVVHTANMPGPRTRCNSATGSRLAQIFAWWCTPPTCPPTWHSPSACSR